MSSVRTQLRPEIKIDRNRSCLSDIGSGFCRDVSQKLFFQKPFFQKPFFHK